MTAPISLTGHLRDCGNRDREWGYPRSGARKALCWNRPMDVAALLLELYSRIPPLGHQVVDPLALPALTTRPAPSANSIGWLVWHSARVQDHHVSELLDCEQIWAGGDWAARFGLEADPRNTGYGHAPAD